MAASRLAESVPLGLNKTALDEIGPERGSLVDRIFVLVVQRIQSRQFPAGTRLPSVRLLAQACQISRDTAARAYDKLVAHGHLESRRGSGFYVKSSARRGAAGARPAKHGAVPDYWRHRLLQTNPSSQGAPGSGNMPERWIDESHLATAFRAVAGGSQKSLFGYGDLQGYLPLRQQLQIKLGDIGIHAEARQIVATLGATEALHLVAMAYMRPPGAYVLVEDPCSYMLIDRIRASGNNFALVPRHADGPDIDTLRAMCERHRPSLFFCSSILHNPTSTNIAPHKAFQILKIAEEFDLTIVEDDTYADLMPATAAGLTRLATLDQLQRVIFIGSFSKTLAPGLRVGFLAANPERIAFLMLFRAACCIAAPSFAERVVYRLLSQGSYRHHCAQLRTQLDAARHAVVEQLASLGVTVAHAPTAGMFVWGSLPGSADAMEVADRLFELGHVMAPGVLFSVANSAPSHMRFNVGSTLNNAAIPALARLLGHARGLSKR